MTTQLANNIRHHHAHSKPAEELSHLSSPHHLFACTQHNCSHAKPVDDCTEIKTHRVKLNQILLLLTAGKGRLGCLSFSYFSPSQWTMRAHDTGYLRRICIERMQHYKEDKTTETSPAPLPRRQIHCYFTSMPAEAVDSSLGLSSDFISLINQLHM